MNPRSIILEYLKFTETKSCTMVAIWVLCEEFHISKEVVSFTLSEMIRVGDIVMDVRDPLFMSVVKWVPKLKVVH